MAVVHDLRDCHNPGIDPDEADAETAPYSASQLPEAAVGAAAHGDIGDSMHASGAAEAVRGWRRSGSGRPSGAGAGAGAGGSTSFVHASIFPGDEFVFAGGCHVLVMAEDKRKAERHLVDLQVGVRKTRPIHGCRCCRCCFVAVDG